MTSFAYPGRSGLNYLIKQYAFSNLVKFLILFSDANESSGSNITSELAFVNSEVFDLRTYSNSIVSTFCSEASVLIPKYLITETSQDPVIATSYQSIGGMLVFSEDDLDDAWITSFNATFTSADVIEFEAPDTLSNFNFASNPNRFFSGGIFYSGNGFTSVPSTPGFQTVEITGVNPTRPIGTNISIRAMGFVLATIRNNPSTVNPGSPETVTFDLIAGRQTVLTF